MYSQILNKQRTDNQVTSKEEKTQQRPSSAMDSRKEGPVSRTLIYLQDFNKRKKDIMQESEGTTKKLKDLRAEINSCMKLIQDYEKTGKNEKLQDNNLDVLCYGNNTLEESYNEQLYNQTKTDSKAQTFQTQQEMYHKTYSQNENYQVASDQEIEQEYTKNVPIHVQGELYVQQQNYSSLLNVVQESQKYNQEQSQQLSTLQIQYEELKTQYDIMESDYKTKILDLSTKMRKLQSQDLQQLFDLYEDEIQKLNKYIQGLQRDNIKLISNAEDQTNSLSQMESRKHLKELTESIAKLRQENAELKTQERKWALSKKILEDVTKKQTVLQTQVQKQNVDLMEKGLGYQEIQAKLYTVQQQNKNQQEIIENLKIENESLKEETQLLRELATQQQQQKTIIRANLDPKRKPILQNVLQRLAKEIRESGNKKCLSLINNALYECEELLNEFEQVAKREQHLLNLVSQAQNNQQDN